MRKKFKKRLLGIILTILMVVSVIPVQQVQPVQAAMTLKVGDKIYFKVISRDNGTFGADNAVPAVYLKTSATDGSGTWQTMTEVSGESNIYQYEVDKDNVTYVAFRRMSEDGIKYWDSMTSPLEINGNMYTSEGWNNSSKTNSNPQNWCTYSEGGETPDPTPSTSNTVYYKKSENSNDTNWDNATNFYVYGFNSDTDKSDIQPMRLTSTAGVYEYTFTKQYAQVIFLRTTRFTSSGKDYSNQTVNLTVPWGKYINPMFTLDGNSDSKDYGKKTGTWSDNTNASTGDEVLKERFYVSTNLVDYINDARLGEGNKTRGYSNNNQGTVVNGSKDGSNVYSYLDAAISGRPWYTESDKDSSACQYTYPLYFGNMYDLLNRYGRRLGGDWFGLNNFSVGANVALDENKFYGAAAQGLVGNKLVDGKMVDPKNPDVVLPYFSGEEIHPYDKNGNIDASKNLSEYYNDLQFPFKQTRDKNGVITYSYDSGSDYAVYYDFEKKSFYEDPDNHIENETKNDNTAPKDGFYPLNKPEDKNNRAAVNMGFGTEFTIPFTLSKDGKINGKDITFNFTGDDDVWVFIDDYLVLDMGGAHRMARGTIDFTKKEVTVDRAFTPSVSTTDAFKGGDPRENQESVKRTKEFTQIKTDDGNFEDIMANDSKVHTLKMFYMERGMIDSNMSVSFNFSPIPSGLTLSKDVDTTPVNDGLKSDVETKDNFDFTVKDNDKDARTEYTYEKDHDGTYTENKITTNGVVEGLADNVYAKNFEYKDKDSEGNKGLKIGTEFEITEHENSNYNTRWFVTDISTGDKKGEGNTLTSNFTLGNKDSGVTKVNYNVNFVNTPKVGTVNITKAWKGDVPETLQKEDFLFKVEVDLDGAAEKDEYSTYALEYTVNGTKYKTDANGDFTLKSGQTAAFAGIPTGATVKVTETKTTDDKSWEVSGTSEKESQPVTETSNETLTITNATKTINSTNKVIYVETGKDTPYTPADVLPGYTVTEKSKGLDYTEKGFNGAEPGKSYTAKYTGSNSDGAIVNGTITVLTYQATDKVYVFDYGLESDIAKKNDNHDGLFEGGTFYNDNAKDAYETTAKLNQITPAGGNNQTKITGDQDVIINKDGSAKGTVTFKPVAFMDKAEDYTYTADITKNGAKLVSNNPETGTTVNGKIKTMPANVVYYEDDFNATSDNKDGTAKIVYSGDTNKVGKSVELTQSNGQTEQYGHDDAYAKGTGDSAGSSTVMTSTTDPNTNKYTTKATFKFKGTGFDVVGRTSTETTTVSYRVKDSSGKVESMGVVDTFYANGDLYQIPVIHVEGLAYSTEHTVELVIGESSVSENEKRNVFYLDGIRIYNPMGEQGDNDYIDNEENVNITKVSDLILGDGKITEKGVTDGEDALIKDIDIPGSKAAIMGYFDNKLNAIGVNVTESIEGDAATDTESVIEYLHSGPNNEVYLGSGSALGMVVKETGDTARTLQIEAKAVKTGTTEESNDASMDLKYLTLNKTGDGTEGKTADTVKTATAMYYKIPVEDTISLGNGYYLVAVLGAESEDGSYVLSFTNVKSKGYKIYNALRATSKEKEDEEMEALRTELEKYIEFDLNSTEQPPYFADFKPAKGLGAIRRGKWIHYDVTVSKDKVDAAKKDASGKPELVLYFNNKGTLTPVTAYVERATTNEDGNYVYPIRFKTPNSRGSFALQLYYKDIETGEKSAEFINAELKVAR